MRPIFLAIVLFICGACHAADPLSGVWNGKLGTSEIVQSTGLNELKP